jgi:hypothetical protein
VATPVALYNFTDLDSLADPHRIMPLRKLEGVVRSASSQLIVLQFRCAHVCASVRVSERAEMAERE